VTATGGGSGNPVTFTIDSSATSFCSITGSTVSFTAVGTCKVNANQAGNANYLAAGQAQQSFAVAKGAQTITFTSTTPAAATVGSTTYTVTATGGASGNAVTFTVDATSSSVCTIAGSTVSFTGVGTCTIDANQATSTNYLVASQVQQSFAVGQGAQAITFTSTMPASATVGGTPYTVTATASSGLAVALTLDATSTGCSLSGSTSGSTVSFTAAGTCKVDANQAGNANYLPAGQLQQSFPVAKNIQTITFTSAPTSPTFGGATYTVTATGGASGNPVTFASATATVCTVSGSTVTFVAAGTCTISADQASSTNYDAAPQVQQTFSVAKGNQTITFTSTAPSSATVGGPTYAVTATASSGLTVIFTSATSAVCTVSGSTVTFVAAGTCTINANQAGNGNYNTAPQVQQTFTVATFAITAATFVGGNKKYTFSGTGGTAGQSVTVKICTTNTFPTCAAVSTTTTTTAVAADGTWLTGQTANLPGGTYYAQATQTLPAKTSAVFSWVA
jgi:hypothetical protein